MYVALDSNILIQNRSKKNQNMRILDDYVRKTESKILIHEIVEAEVVRHIKETISNDFSQIQDAFHKMENYDIENMPILDLTKISTKNLEKRKEDFLNDLYNKNTLRVKIDGRALREVISRAIERKRPCSKNGEELRDAIIWLNLLKYCKKIKKDLAFISNDDHFASEDKKALHRDLIDDAKNHKIEVEYFNTLEDFLKKHAEPIADISLEWVSGRIDMTEVKSIIKEFLLYNDVAHYFTPCNYLDQNYFIPEGKPEFPLWASPRIEFNDFFVWRFDDKHVELSLIFYAYIEAEFSCVPKGHSSAYSIPSYQDPYSSSYASSYALHSNPYSSDYCARHSHSGFGSGYYGLWIHDRFNLGSYPTTTTDKINCFANLIFRISAKKDGDKILLEIVEDLYKA